MAVGPNLIRPVQQFHLKILEEKLKMHLEDKGIYPYDLSSYLPTLSGAFTKE